MAPAGVPPSAAELAATLDRPVVVFDVGCRWGGDPRWAGLGDRVRWIGFDADAAECDRLRAAGGAGVEYVAAALGAAPGTAPLYLTVEPACSSLYPPDQDLAARYPELACTALARRVEVELTTLDLWAAAAGVEAVDFVKLDTQASELDILRGAERLLPTVRALEIEVELNPIYRGQPLFGDVDRFLRQRGFVLWRLGHLVHYGLPGERSAFAVTERQFHDSRPVEFTGSGGQLFWGHAHYVAAGLADGRDAEDPAQARRDACLATLLGFHDLAAQALARSAGAAPLAAPGPGRPPAAGAAR